MANSTTPYGPRGPCSTCGDTGCPGATWPAECWQKIAADGHRPEASTATPAAGLERGYRLPGESAEMVTSHGEPR